MVLPDYQGLGRPGLPHSILDAVALGNNLTDAARAARRVLPSASPQWAAFGLGEGGLAAWSAAERAGVYGRGMNMLGAVAIAPYADLSPRADPARIKDMSTPEQFRLQIQMLQSLSTMESDFDIDAHRSAAVRAAWGLLVDCAPTDRAGAERAFNALASADFAPRDAAATEDLRRRLERLALPVGEPARARRPCWWCLRRPIHWYPPRAFKAPSKEPARAARPLRFTPRSVSRPRRMTWRWILPRDGCRDSSTGSTPSMSAWEPDEAAHWCSPDP